LPSRRRNRLPPWSTPATGDGTFHLDGPTVGLKDLKDLKDRMSKWRYLL
jgi:hypothetical protein